MGNADLFKTTFRNEPWQVDYVDGFRNRTIKRLIPRALEESQSETGDNKFFFRMFCLNEKRIKSYSATRIATLLNLSTGEYGIANDERSMILAVNSMIAEGQPEISSWKLDGRDLRQKVPELPLDEDGCASGYKARLRMPAFLGPLDYSYLQSKERGQSQTVFTRAVFPKIKFSKGVTIHFGSWPDREVVLQVQSFEEDTQEIKFDRYDRLNGKLVRASKEIKIVGMEQLDELLKVGV